VVRELGSKRRETVWSLSVIRVKELKMSRPSTRGLGYLLLINSSQKVVNIRDLPMVV